MCWPDSKVKAGQLVDKSSGRSHNRIMPHAVAADTSKADDTDATKTHRSAVTDRLADFICIIAIFAFACLVCFPIFSGKVPIPSGTLYLWGPWSQLPHEPIANPNLADATLLYLPSTVFARNALDDGEWPMWDPYSFGGFPYSANSQSQLFYPLTWAMWLLPLTGAIQALAIFNLLLAGCGMYLFARYQAIGPIGALIAGLAFSGSGMMQLALEIPGVASVYGWLPWMLLAMDKALRTHNLAWSAAATLVCGLQVVAGHLQWVLYSYLVLGCWVAWRISFVESSITVRARLSMLLRAVLIGVGGLALAAVHLAPFLELAGMADRTAGRVSSNSWPFTYLLRMLAPQYFGTATPGLGVPLIFNDLWYVGIVPLFLAVVAIILRPGKVVWFWLSVALVAVAVTFGIGPFLYARWLPGLNSLLPMRIGYILIFSVAILAGLGYDVLKQKLKDSRIKAYSVVGSVFVGFGMLLIGAWLAALAEPSPAFQTLKVEQVVRAALFLIAGAGLLALSGLRSTPVRIGHRLYALQPLNALLVLVLTVDLLTLVPGYNAWVGTDQVLPSTPAIDWLRARSGYERVMGLDSPGPLLNPNTQSLFGIHSVAGYDSLHTRRLEQYWSAVDPTIRPSNRSGPYASVFIRPQAYTSTLASLMNVRYIVAANSFAPQVPLDVAFKDEVTIYENKSALPRAFLVAQAQVLNPETILKRLAEPGFEPSAAVLLEEEPPAGEKGEAQQDLGSVRVSSYHRNSVVLEAEMSAPGWLVLSDQNYPGWSATVDGKTEKVYTAYYLFRALHLGPGRHRIAFSFLPQSMIPAGFLSIVTLAFVFVIPVYGVLFRNRLSPDKSKKDMQGNRDGGQ